MSLRINRILDDTAIAQILERLFINRPIKIIRTISRTGRNSISWVHYENEVTGQRLATFVSFEDLLRSFWIWLETVNLMAIAIFQRQAISEVVFAVVEVGERVFLSPYGWVEIIDKDRSETLKQPRLWIESSDSLDIVEPCYVEIF